ncbi:MAG: alpha/beta fold hydrolase [Tateyamaria sp.]|uniref:alpha/beta fold hydrolase n=1 Tax=Tateyamaria sp. TaxID=1929288 RepID=UPI0032A00B17
MERCGAIVDPKGLSGDDIGFVWAGANYHLQSPDIGLYTHAQGVLNHLFFNDINDAIVVAHSYGGGVLSEALVGDEEGRISHALYLDAFRLEEGQSVAGVQSNELVDGMKKAQQSGEMIPPRPVETWKDIWGMVGPAVQFAEPRVKPMSPNCFLETVRGDPFSDERKYTYMRCSQNDNAHFKGYLQASKADPRFQATEVDGHHNVMVLDPLRMAEAISAAA